MQKDAKQLIVDFLKIQRGYQFTRRSTITKERFRDVVHGDESKILSEDNNPVMETLIEHVGHLPIIASFFHEYSTNSNDIDLGRVLTILSVHDIGETILGDINTYIKTDLDSAKEIEVAHSILSNKLVSYFDEYESQVTLESKYAKFVDLIAPIFHKLEIPYITQKRFQSNGRKTEDIIKKKRHHLEWDPSLLEIFDICLDQLYRAETGKELLFPAEEYDILYKS